MTIVKGTAKVLAQYRKIGKDAERAAEQAVKGVSFDARDAIQDHVKANLSFASENTKRFVSKFKVAFKKAGTLFEAIISPGGKVSQEILEHHTQARSLTAKERSGVDYDGMLAIPIRVDRGPSGRVKKADHPTNITKRGAKGRTHAFVNKARTVILRHIADKQVEVAYALRPSTPTTDRLDIAATARRIVMDRLPVQLARAVNRIILKKG